jgi:hypothetical protein
MQSAMLTSAPYAQASASVLEAAAPAAEPIAAATSVVDSNAAAPSSLDLAQVGSTAAMMEAAVSSVSDAAAAGPAPGASVVDSNLEDRRQSNAEVTTEVRLSCRPFLCTPAQLSGRSEKQFTVDMGLHSSCIQATMLCRT